MRRGFKITDLEITALVAERGMRGALAYRDYTHGFRCGLERKFDGAHVGDIFGADFARGFADAMRLPADVRQQLISAKA